MQGMEILLQDISLIADLSVGTDAIHSNEYITTFLQRKLLAPAYASQLIAFWPSGWFQGLHPCYRQKASGKTLGLLQNIFVIKPRNMNSLSNTTI